MNNDVLAVVAGEAITNADFDAYLQNVPQEQRMYAQNPQYRQHFVDQLIALRAYAKLGEDLKIDETDEFKKIMDNARKDLLAQMRKFRSSMRRFLSTSPRVRLLARSIF